MAAAKPILLFTKKLAQLGDDVASCRTVNINSTKIKTAAKDLVQEYFRTVGPQLIEIGIDKKIIDALEVHLQGLNKLASGNNAKASYKVSLRGAKDISPNLEVAVAVIEGQKRKELEELKVILSKTESAILTTLDSLVPTASLSYRQATLDLDQKIRSSYRGVAAELREVLRELLDHMAPDEDVIKSAGFKLEKNMTKPTQRQKAKFILNSRNLSKTAQSTPLHTLQILDEIISAMARSVYERASLSTHVGATKQEVIQFKRYLDVVLCELLQIS